jgi:arginine utilization protein RocB
MRNIYHRGLLPFNIFKGKLSPEKKQRKMKETEKNANKEKLSKRNIKGENRNKKQNKSMRFYNIDRKVSQKNQLSAERNKRSIEPLKRFNSLITDQY